MTDPVIAVAVSPQACRHEGPGRVLDVLGETAGATTVLLASTSWSAADAGRSVTDSAALGVGAQRRDTDRRGGSYFTVHPELYRDTRIGPIPRADDAEGDVLADVVGAATGRGMAVHAWVDESSHARALRDLPSFTSVLEVDIWNKPARRPCYRNPDYRRWHVAIAEDHVRHYDLDGFHWSTDRSGPLTQLLSGPTAQGLGLVVCYCSYCRDAGAARGLDWRRAQQGHRQLVLLNARAGTSDLPAEGVFVGYWRLLLEYPEVLGWQALWMDGLHQLYRDVFGTIKALEPRVRVGWTIDHAASINPFVAAGQDLAQLSHLCDYLRVDAYRDSAEGELGNLSRQFAGAVLADAGPRQALDWVVSTARVSGATVVDEPADDAGSPRVRLDPAYVADVTQRSVAGGEGRCDVLIGVEVAVPATLAAGRVERPGSADRVEADVRAALGAGAAGVVLGRTYAEMDLRTLAGAARARTAAPQPAPTDHDREHVHPQEEKQ